MEIDPSLYDHVEAMVAVARTPVGAVTALDLSELLSKSLHRADALLANLAASGLLRTDRADWERPTGYRLVRSPDAIHLDEIAGAAGFDEGPGPVTTQSALDGTRMLSNALEYHVREVLAGFTLADVLSTDETAATNSAPPSGPTASPSAEPPTPQRMGISVEALSRQVDAGKVPVVIDVRASPSPAWPAPPWARWIPLEHLADRMPVWPAGTQIVTVCSFGMRSLIAATYLRLEGYSATQPLVGGLEAWHRSAW